MILQEWIEREALNIKACFQEQLERILRSNRYNNNHFDANRLHFSEMGLGYALQFMNGPDWFDYEWGEVVTPEGKTFDHAFFRKEDEVVCLTFGQFLLCEGHERPEQSVALLREKAPNLVTCVKDVYALHGKKQEIKESLGLTYKQWKR